MKPFLLSFLLGGVLFAGMASQTANAQERYETPRELLGTMSVTSVEPADVAAALGIDPGLVVTASFGATDPIAYAIFDQAASGFPTQGATYLVLSTGTANQDYLLNPANPGPSVANNSPNQPPAFDIAQLVLTLQVPADAVSFSFDFKFFSTEYPVYVGSPFNDAFIVELGESNFSFDGVNVVAPNNIVFDENGQRISINTTGALGMEPEFAAGTAWFPSHAATPTLSTVAQIPAGAETITLYFTIFDVSDDILDSAIFLDNFRFLDTDGGGTLPADNTPPECSGTLMGNVFQGMATDLLSVDPNNRGIAGLSVSGTNLMLQNITPPIPSEPPFPESVSYDVVLVDASQSGSGTVTATDGAGNTCQISVNIPVDGDPVCFPPEFSRTVATNPNRIELTITDPEGIVRVNFTDDMDNPALNNLEASSPQMTSVDGIRFVPNDPGNPPSLVQFTLLATAGSVSYFALLENACGAETLIDPQHQFESTTPEVISLDQNYPNPFSSSTQIGFQLPEASSVTVTVYDFLGREVAVIGEGRFEAGQHILTWDGSGDNGTLLPSGTYLYRIQTGDVTETRRLTIIR